MPSLFSPEQRARYERDGYLIVPALFDAHETGLLRDAIEQDPHLRASVYERKDAEGKPTRMAVWNHPYLEHHHARYTPLHKVDDDAVRKAGVKLAPEGSDHFRKQSANPPELTRRF